MNHLYHDSRVQLQLKSLKRCALSTALHVHQLLLLEARRQIAVPLQLAAIYTLVDTPYAHPCLNLLSK